MHRIYLSDDKKHIIIEGLKGDKHTLNGLKSKVEAFFNNEFIRSFILFPLN